jgi:hypothetical protein
MRDARIDLVSSGKVLVSWLRMIEDEASSVRHAHHARSAGLRVFIACNGNPHHNQPFYDIIPQLLSEQLAQKKPLEYQRIT